MARKWLATRQALLACALLACALLACAMLACALGLGLGARTVFAAQTSFAEAKKFTICWSRYTGWEPWGYVNHSGALRKWALHYGIKVELKRYVNYGDSIDDFASGKCDGTTMTNIDALGMPESRKGPPIALILGSFSHGNDGIVSKTTKSIKGLRGKKVYLVKNSVSHFLLWRALKRAGLTTGDVELVDVKDSKISETIRQDPKAAAATWHPILSSVLEEKGMHLLFDSSAIGAEIMDLMVVRGDAPETLKKVLLRTWYEVIGDIEKNTLKAKEMVEYMAHACGTTKESFAAQLKTTVFLNTPAKALRFLQGEKIIEAMTMARAFAEKSAGLPAGAVGIRFPGGRTVGDPNRIKLRIETRALNSLEAKP